MKRINKKLLSNILYLSFTLSAVIIAIIVFVKSPVQNHFAGMSKDDVWYGDGWYYLEDDATINLSREAEVSGKHYIKAEVKNGIVNIAKRIEEKPLSDEFFCFRVCAQDIKVYLNDSCIYEYEISKEDKKYTVGMYMLHQIPAAEFDTGDVITLELSEVAGKSTLIQCPAIGDRYALNNYIFLKAAPNLLLSVFVLILLLLLGITGYSPILVDKIHSKKSIKWLASFLVTSMIYFVMDSGCMELLFNRMFWVEWMSDIAVLMLPMPFLMYTQTVFLPDYKRFEYLAGFNFAVAILSIIGFLTVGFRISNAFVLIHPIIIIGITVCVISFIKEKMIPGAEVVIGYTALWAAAVVIIIMYWSGMRYPLSVIFGIGLVIFGICMFLWTVRENNEKRRRYDEAERLRMQRDKENAEEANEQKNRFLSQMSHEIRTPLNAILGMNELIMQGAENDETKRYSSDIQNAGRTLLALINDVLDFSKIENGKLDIVISNYSLSSVLNDAILMVQEKITAKGLELRLDVNSDIPDSLRGDEIRIKQIILNLMTNAVKYTQTGWLELSVQKEGVVQPGADICIIIRVSDSGIGIRQEEMPRLFGEFERLDRNKNRNIEGTGLGLSITSRLVSLMGGDIGVESEYGTGSTFTVRLPQTVVSAEGIGDYRKRIEYLTKSEKPEKRQTLSFHGKKIFVVDDNEMNLEVIAAILEMLDISVSRADNGQSAINHLEKDVYDLIITDDMMPGMNGTELMRHIKGNSEGANCQTPVVVLTANAVTGAREEYLKSGFDGYLTKPIDIDVLQRTLKRFLQ